MKRNILWLAAALLVLTGCQLARTDQAEVPKEDRMVGVYVTREHLDLFDADAYFQDHMEEVLSGGELTADTTPYEGRIYAELITEEIENADGARIQTQSYVFPEELGGIAFYASRISGAEEQEPYWTTTVDPGLSDPQFGIHSNGMEDSVDLEGTIYVIGEKNVQTGKPYVSFYFNPVYQTPDGQVYLTGGTGSSFSTENGVGVGFTQTLSEEHRQEENGTESKTGCTVAIKVESMELPETITVQMLSRDHQVIWEADYAPGGLPEELTPVAGTAYVLMQTTRRQADGTELTDWEIFDTQDENLATYRAMEDGICTKHLTKLNWKAR